MLKSALFLSVLPAVLLSGCEDGSSNLFLGKKPKTVEFKRSVDLAGERISIESFGAEDLFVADTFLVFITPKLDKCYSVFSTTGYRHHGNLVSRGQGPGEFVFPVQPVFTEKNGDEVSVAFYDTNKSALVYLNLTRSLADSRPVFDKMREFREIQGIYKLFPLEEGKMFVDYCDFERLDQ
ncbi:MAG: hypothetical protein LBF09_00430, partial [Odoribacteraceae bacterium]|nr:hypothetical protein [Odoribacteraceae bacterium]